MKITIDEKLKEKYKEVNKIAKENEELKIKNIRLVKLIQEYHNLCTKYKKLVEQLINENEKARKITLKEKYDETIRQILS